MFNTLPYPVTPATDQMYDSNFLLFVTYFIIVALTHRKPLRPHHLSPSAYRF